MKINYTYKDRHDLYTMMTDMTDDGAARLHRRLTGHVDHAFADYA
jgi:hypothetical protein